MSFRNVVWASWSLLTDAKQESLKGTCCRFHSAQGRRMMMRRRNRWIKATKGAASYIDVFSLKNRLFPVPTTHGCLCAMWWLKHEEQKRFHGYPWVFTGIHGSLVSCSANIAVSIFFRSPPTSWPHTQASTEFLTDATPQVSPLTNIYTSIATSKNTKMCTVSAHSQWTN